MNKTVIKAEVIAQEMIEQVQIVLPTDIKMEIVLKVVRYTADRIKNNTPMYTGNLNPKWELYDNVVKEINNKLNAI